MENNGYLYKQLETQNSLGELLRKTCTGNLGKKFEEDSVVDHE